MSLFFLWLKFKPELVCPGLVPVLRCGSSCVHASVGVSAVDVKLSSA